MKKKHFITSAICVILALLMVITVVIGVLGSGALAVSQAQIDALEDQKKELSDKRAGMQASIDELKSQKADVLVQKQALDERNEVAQQEIDLINEQIDLYTQLIAEKEKELNEAKAAEEAQLAAYKKHVRTMEENGRFSYLAVIFSSKSLSELLSNLDMIDEIMSADKRLYDNYIETRENTERVKEEYEDVLEELSEKQEELEVQKAKLEEEIASAVQIIIDLEKDIEEYKKQEEAVAADEANIQAKISQLVQQKKAEEEAARRQAAQQNVSYTGPGASSTGSFSWPCPASTYITSKFGWRIHPIFGTKRFHNGVDIAASSGSSILAADGGTIAVATKSSSAGNYVVIYHSGGYTTTYMHMSSIAVSVGDTVSKGDTIGYVGSTGWSSGPHLHFEISLNGTRQDPLSYFSGYTLAPGA